MCIRDSLSTIKEEVVDFTLSEFEPWLSLSPTSGATPATIDLAFDTTGLLDGVYTTAVTASSPSIPTLDLPVTLTVQSPVGELAISPSSMAFALAPQETASQTAQLTTTGGGSTTFTIVDDADWLTLSTVSGTLSGAATGSGPTPVEVMIDSSGLADGTYTGLVTLSSPDSIDVGLPVTLTVATPPNEFRFDPPSADFLLSFDANDSRAVTLSTTEGSATDFTLLELSLIHI